MMRVLRAASVQTARIELAWLLMALPTLGMLAGCSARRSADPPVVESGFATPPYRIHVGDALNARFHGTPHPHTTATTRIDGRISPSLVGDLQAAGPTTR